MGSVESMCLPSVSLPSWEFTSSASTTACKCLILDISVYSLADFVFIIVIDFSSVFQCIM